eukprot:UN17467
MISSQSVARNNLRTLSVSLPALRVLRKRSTRMWSGRRERPRRVAMRRRAASRVRASRVGRGASAPDLDLALVIYRAHASLGYYQTS